MLQDTCDESYQKKDKYTESFDGRYKTLFEQVNAAAFLTTLNGHILEANHKSCELLDYTWDELLELSLRDFFPASTDWCQLIEEISSKGGINFETENIRKDGIHIPVEISTSLFKMDKEPIMLTLIQDITQRKKAEKKLKESEKKYRGLFECTTDGIIVLDARGEILDINKRALKLFDLNFENVVGNNFLSMNLLTPKSLPIVVKQFEELLSDKMAKSYETEIMNKTGGILDIELSSFFLCEKDDQEVNFVVIIRDISGKKQAEIDLMRSHELLQTLLDNIPDSIYFKDDNHKFILVNKAKAAHSNVLPEKMIGKTDFDFLPEEEAKKAFNDDQEIIKLGKFIINKIEKITRNDGLERWVSVTKVPRFDKEGNIIGSMGISRDITDQKKLE